MTRYKLLRESIGYFAAPAGEQLACRWGADDAVNDTPYPLEDMLDHGEISAAEFALIRPLEDRIARYCAQADVKPWDDEALLLTDPQWAQIRHLAATVLARLPDEQREAASGRAPSRDR